MPATPSTSHAARAAMLAITSLATRTAPRVAASPIRAAYYVITKPALGAKRMEFRGSDVRLAPNARNCRQRLRPLHVAVRPGVDPDHVAALDEQRHLDRSEEHTSGLQSHSDLVCRLLLE